MASFPFFKPALFAAGLVFIAAVPTMAAGITTYQISAAPYQAELGGRSVSFLARDLETGADFVLEGSDRDRRHSPHSTFKIANLLIALEYGIAGSLEDWRAWDKEKRPAQPHWPDAWRQGQTLGEAFARSAVWYFQDLALEIGATAYRSRLAEWNYGNADVPLNSDTFWLDGSLRISLNEQVAFLANLVNGELGVNPENIAALDQASLSSTGAGWTHHGKTGLGPDDYTDWDGAYSGWYVGYFRRDDSAPIVFALHAIGPSFSSIAEFRRPFALKLLAASGLIDNPAP